MKSSRLFFVFVLFTAVVNQAITQISLSMYQEMRWRMIGPHRGGRTVGATGVPGQPNVFYIGVNNGGVWKSSDYGRTWFPVFDEQPTGSIGTIAVAPSNPNILYVGSGEGLQRPDLSVGDGMYKSTDAGKTWKHLGLGDGQQICAILVHPQNPDLVYVAVLGHPYGANEERGVYRSGDGGQSWQKILYKDENTGAIALSFDPVNPQTMYADLWAGRQGPWENGAWQGKNSGLFKSTDGGSNWRQLTKGLPTTDQGLGRIGFCVAPSDPSRLFAVVDAPRLGGLYKSDDAGESWEKVNSDQRLWGRGSDFAEVKVHPKDKDIVLIANVACYRSVDAGKTFSSFRGAPGGDDYHTIWINPDNPDVMLVVADQGAIVTVNGGQTFSSWYNQPTAQFYHVITDNQFPYYVYGGQQESGSVGIASRGNDGQISFREWHPVSADEYAYVAPDPLNPNIIYGGRVTKFDRTTGQVQNIAPEAIRSGKYRTLRTMPLLFSPVNPKLLFCATNVLFKTTNGGHSWDIISPDLAREHPDVPENIGIYRSPDMQTMARRGVIYALGPSQKDENIIWAGTDDGLVHVTWDGGKQWQNVTPPGVTSWSKISQIDAGHFDAKTAYIAVNRFRLDDLKPHIYRTHDGGKTWKEIVNGLPSGPVNVVRQDPVRQGLLFAGSELAVSVSFDDGESWYPLRLNMPATSIRDLVIHNDDVVVGTHGRSFWILDDITPLRQLGENVVSSDAFLFKPQAAFRVRWNMNTDTPLPQEEPAGQNPPDGAVIDYYLKSAAAEPVTLEIYDSANKLVRRFGSTDKPDPVNPDEYAIPMYWIRAPQMLSAASGMHRFVWDLHYAKPEGVRQSYPIAAIFGQTATTPTGPWVHPGEYTAKLTVDGKTSTQRFTVKMDPRVKTRAAGLRQQFDLSMQCYGGLHQAYETMEQSKNIRSQLKALIEKAGPGALKDSVTSTLRKTAMIEGGEAERDIDIMYFSVQRGRRQEENLAGLQTRLVFQMLLLQSADATPTTQAVAAVRESQQSLNDVLGRWNDLRKKEIPRINDQLKKAGLSLITL
jgi:photosystem II stability/assembly factor-like uncharacterized protein